MAEHPVIDAARIDAVIFDLDGVITKTAVVHEVAWAQLFDEYLEGRSAGAEFRPFSSDDYLKFVDGKPRYDGVQSFLESRDIRLPMGTPEDGPEQETICGLGNRKNSYFLDTVQQHGVEPYESSVELVRTLQRHDIGTALISSSRNVDDVLEAAGLSGLFVVQVDGVVADEIGIPGKPDPAVFLEAAERLGVTPDRAAVVEDALSGVEAGRRGGFAMVLGVDRADQASALAAAGADFVVGDLAEVAVVAGDTDRASVVVTQRDLPSALDSLEEIGDALATARPAVFLDYDGTLTPIVGHPDWAVLSADTRSVVDRLANTVTVAVLSGRDVADVRDKIAVPGIWYAGSHGFDIIDPSGDPVEDERLRSFHRYLPSLDSAEAALRAAMGHVEGALVERKKYAIAVHYRQVADADLATVDEAVRRTAPSYADLRMTTGKKIYELRPDLDWDKGTALRWLLDELGLAGPDVMPFYLGDDTTDEDAFRELRPHGFGIVVGRADVATVARYALDDTDDVRVFLAALIELSGGRP